MLIQVAGISPVQGKDSPPPENVSLCHSERSEEPPHLHFCICICLMSFLNPNPNVRVPHPSRLYAVGGKEHSQTSQFCICSPSTSGCPIHRGFMRWVGKNTAQPASFCICPPSTRRVLIHRGFIEMGGKAQSPTTAHGSSPYLDPRIDDQFSPH